ncbi:hypothetical protein K2173_009409 [Erythroxylum novogranatense]|uniref:Uncharacterized protein n=1 Tax=Erythroxylum novogranatense TaxID=1862640 RepID=A0AAV8U6L7_9ROSI|nr:hypothetical protein K2173_009409 [Erythroxylum novogranatense]
MNVLFREKGHHSILLVQNSSAHKKIGTAMNAKPSLSLPVWNWSLIKVILLKVDILECEPSVGVAENATDSSDLCNFHLIHTIGRVKRASREIISDCGKV